MALKTNELFASAPGVGSQKRISPRVIKPKVFALGVGTIPKGALVSYDTTLNQWAPWDNGGANGRDTMKGVAWPDDITLDASDETIGQVMLAGNVHRDDIELNGQLQADVDAELQTEARNLEIHVEGLTEVR